MSLDNLQKISEGLTYDDVLLAPAYSEVLPREVSLKSKFTRNITVNTPIVSAAMDTVTESELAIAIAQQGGIGVVHKNMTIEQQAMQVRKVKRSESGMIIDPITLLENALVQDALQLMKENSIGGIPVVNEQKVLKGILTNRDLRFEKNMLRPVAEIMTSENIITTGETTDLTTAEVILQQNRIEKLPVVDEQNRLIGLITYRDIIKVKEHPYSCKDSLGRLRVAAAVGVTHDTMERVTALVEAGADAVKVGIGPGSICTTRVIAGVGVPQLTAVNEVAQAIAGTGVPVIADGGIRYTGDIVKAIAAGADIVMLGSMFAGVEESPGETIIFEGRKFKSYRGMGSIEAMQKGSKDRYFQDAEDDIKKLVPEGISGRVPYRGKLIEVMFQIIGGLRAGMGYCGAPTISKLQGARFVRITSAGVRESHPHDVTITREAPNYSIK